MKFSARRQFISSGGTRPPTETMIWASLYVVDQGWGQDRIIRILAIRLPSDVESRLNALAMRTGRSKTRYATEAITELKWSGKFRQRAKMYSALTTGYRNDDETQFFGQV